MKNDKKDFRGRMYLASHMVDTLLPPRSALVADCAKTWIDLDASRTDCEEKPAKV